MKKVHLYISDTAPPQVIDSHDPHYEALRSLSTCQIKYLEKIHQKGLLSSEAVSCIQKYVKIFPNSRSSEAG